MRYYGMFVLALTLGVTSYSDESSIEEIPVQVQASSAEDQLEEFKGLGVRSLDPGVIRPIIRGSDGSRVKHLEPLRIQGLEPLRIQDLEPSRIQYLYDAENIEVLRGPRGLEDLSYPDVEKIEVLRGPRGLEDLSYPDVEKIEVLRGPRGELFKGRNEVLREPRVPLSVPDSSIPEGIDFGGVAVETLEMMQVTDCITPMLGPIDELDLSQLERIVVDPDDYEGVRICPGQ